MLDKLLTKKMLSFPFFVVTLVSLHTELCTSIIIFRVCTELEFYVKGPVSLIELVASRDRLLVHFLSTTILCYSMSSFNIS